MGDEDLIEVWTENPNGVAEASEAQYNDLATRTVKLGMEGSYTLDPTGGDFATFNGVRTELGDRGVCGPVTIEVADGVYTER